MLASKNTIPAVTTTAGGYHWLSVLAGELAVRLRESREVTPGLWPKTIVLSSRSALAANPWQHRTIQMPFPFTRHLDADYIAKFGRRLWDDSIGKQERIKLTNISLQFTGLAKLEAGQRGIEGFFSKGAAKRDVPKEGRADEAGEVQIGSGASDVKTEVTKRERSTSRAPEPAPKRPRGPEGIESFLSRSSSTPTRPTTPVTVDSDSTSASESVTPAPAPADPNPAGSSRPSKPAGVKANSEDQGDETAWVCPKCLERFVLPDHIPASEAEEWKRVSKQEHEDFHFALSLQEGGSPTRHPRPPLSSASSSSSKAKRKKGNPDIKSFFAPKK